MKLASRVLGGLTLAMLVVVIVLTFISAADIVKGLSVEQSESNDVYAVVADGVSALLMMLGYVGYILMNALGCALIIYLICFCVSYGKLYKGKSNPLFIKYSAYIAGFIMAFETVLFAFRPSAGWKTFVVLLIMTALTIAYAAVSLKYLKDCDDTIIKKDDRYDEPPTFTFN